MRADAIGVALDIEVDAFADQNPGENDGQKEDDAEDGPEYKSLVDRDRPDGAGVKRPKDGEQAKHQREDQRSVDEPLFHGVSLISIIEAPAWRVCGRGGARDIKVKDLRKCPPVERILA
jgi:hypothetical protein